MKIAHLKQLYNFYNKTLFDGKLVSDVTFRITSARSYWGACWCYYDNDPAKREYKIMVASRVATHKNPLVTPTTIIIHEMIHLFQYMTYPQSVMLDKGYAAHDRVFFNYLDMIEYQHGIPMLRDFQIEHPKG